MNAIAVEAGSPRRPTLRGRRKSTRAALGAAAIVVVSLGLVSRMAELSSVWRRISTIANPRLLGLGVLAIGSLLAYGFVLMSAMPGLASRRRPS